jgi:hypothetical protein
MIGEETLELAVRQRLLRSSVARQIAGRSLQIDPAGLATLPAPALRNAGKRYATIGACPLRDGALTLSDDRRFNPLGVVSLPAFQIAFAPACVAERLMPVLREMPDRRAAISACQNFAPPRSPSFPFIVFRRIAARRTTVNLIPRLLFERLRTPLARFVRQVL